MGCDLHFFLLQDIKMYEVKEVAILPKEELTIL